MSNSEVDRLARIVWDYHLMHHQLKPVDAVFVLGSHDIRVAEYAADLFMAGWAPLLICSGTGFGHSQASDLLGTAWEKAEADVFAEIAIKRGVPAEKIIVENTSTNTGENVRFTKQLLAERGIAIGTFMLVQKPYMERRTFATFKKIWPEKDFVVTSPPISFANYPNAEISQDDVINIMVGDLQRIKLYPAKGFQIKQRIPDDVWAAYEKLVSFGYTKHLMKE